MTDQTVIGAYAFEPVDAQLDDGTFVHIRGLRADDRRREIEFLQSLSEQTLYYRAMTPLRYLSRHMLDQLMEVDGHDRVALVATVWHEGREQFMGVARYAAAEGPGSVEFAITVTDAWHHRGVASLLLEHLVLHAKRVGIQRMFGVVLPENRRMLALARKLGFDVHYDAAKRLMSAEKVFDASPPDARTTNGSLG